MRNAIIIVCVISSGCTALSLERRALNQSKSVTELRYQQSLNCLAAVAAEPTTLPSFALLADGGTAVKDVGSLSSDTVWTRALQGFASETFGLQASRNPQHQWTLAPVGEHNRLEAMRCACQVALSRDLDEECVNILGPPTDKSHGFSVLQKLTCLPHGWLHVGTFQSVPHDAYYKAHCGQTWVWIDNCGIAGLAGFTLVLLDIATVDDKSLTLPRVSATIKIEKTKEWSTEESRSLRPEEAQAIVNNESRKIEFLPATPPAIRVRAFGIR